MLNVSVQNPEKSCIRSGIATGVIYSEQPECMNSFMKQVEVGKVMWKGAMQTNLCNKYS